MARMIGAVWIGPTVNRTEDGMSVVRGLALHIQQGTEQGSEAWFKNPASKASAHFLNPKKGPLRQLVDTADRAWAQAAGNPNWISVENEGVSGEPLNDSQLSNAAQLFAWVHRTYNTVPLQLADTPADGGLGWHGMGGAAWGNHPNCPGKPIIAQRPQILAEAERLLGLVPGAYVPYPGAAWFHMGRRSSIVARMHDRLVEEGCDRYQSTANKDVIGSGDVLSYEAWQHKCGFTGPQATWPPGPTTWNLLRVPRA